MCALRALYCIRLQLNRSVSQPRSFPPRARVRSVETVGLHQPRRGAINRRRLTELPVSATVAEQLTRSERIPYAETQTRVPCRPIGGRNPMGDVAREGVRGGGLYERRLHWWHMLVHVVGVPHVHLQRTHETGPQLHNQR